MAQPKRTSKTTGKKRTPAKKRKATGASTGLPVFRILFYLFLLFFLILSLAVLFYVVFFQVVVADERSAYGTGSQAALMINDGGENREMFITGSRYVLHRGILTPLEEV